MNGLPVATTLPVAAPEAPADRLTALFDTHYDRLYRLARRLVPTSDEALDLVQEAFLRIARAPMSVPHGFADEEAWLVRILVNIRRDQWRRDAVRRRHTAEWRPGADVTSHDEAALLARDAVWRALDTLAPRRRAVVVMHELEGLGVKEVAVLLGISAVTVRWHLSRGRRELARILGPHTGEKDDKA
jgi:RNA polymerase sigma-70 factor (ECF subfamily)